jgi:hypothetical protein
MKRNAWIVMRGLGPKNTTESTKIEHIWCWGSSYSFIISLNCRGLVKKHLSKYLFEA